MNYAIRKWERRLDHFFFHHFGTPRPHHQRENTIQSFELFFSAMFSFVPNFIGHGLQISDIPLFEYLKICKNKWSKNQISSIRPPNCTKEAWLHRTVVTRWKSTRSAFQNTKKFRNRFIIVEDRSILVLWSLIFPCARVYWCVRGLGRALLYHQCV